MKIIILTMAFVACVYAEGYSYQQPAPAPQNTYIPPAPPAPKNTYIPPAPPAPKNTYIPPAPVEQPKNSYIPPPPPAPVEQPKNTYIPPAPVEQPQNTYIPPAAESIEGPAQDGYRYKTVRRRVVYKHRA